MNEFIEPSVWATTIVARNFNSNVAATHICVRHNDTYDNSYLSLPIPKLEPEPEPNNRGTVKPIFDFITRIRNLEL